MKIPGSNISRHMKRTFAVCLATLAVALSVSGQRADIQARVIRVIDGDTIDIFADGTKLRIRFEGVDCPESGQAGGSEAKDFTTRLLNDKLVTVRLQGAHENRIIGRVFVDRRDVSAELVRAGMAWHYASLSKDKILAVLEKNARASKAGLWSRKDPMPPWEYRRYSQKPKPTQLQGPFHGNVKNHIFHSPGCAFYQCTFCTQKFDKREKALKAGYKPCKTCKP
jgi:micrococcal nuclease